MIGESVQLGPISLRVYGTLLLLAFLVPMLLLRRELDRAGLDPNIAQGLTAAAIIGGLLGGRAYYLLEHLDAFLEHPASMLWTGAGLVWYGGLAGAILAVIGYLRYREAPLPQIFDLAAPLVALGQGIGRIGCFLSGDGDYGPPTDVPWAMSFPDGVVPTTERVHPTPLYDTVLLFAIAGLLWSLRTRDLPTWTRFSLYLVLMGGARIATEFYRRTPEVVLGLTTAQVISVGVMIIGAGALVARTRAARSS